MTVKAILSRKGNDVVTAEPNATLAEAVRILSARRIGALVEKHPEETLSIMRGWMVQENS